MQIPNGFDEFFCLRSNLSNDNIISAQRPGLKTGVEDNNFFVWNGVRTGRHTPTKSYQEYTPPGGRFQFLQVWIPVAKRV